ncbi:MAG: type II/IV secretion system protein [Vampirovibrionales bacterium]|nr:type II/IV secretion system protein [Vampirovibrionales bacterium]
MTASPQGQNPPAAATPAALAAQGDLGPSRPMPAPNARKRIGELLMEAGYIAQADLDAALKESARSGERLGQTLIRQGKITCEQLGERLSQQHNARYAHIARLRIDPALLEMLPQAFIRQKMALPIAREGGRLVVAMVDPGDRAAHDEITFITGMRPQAMVTTAHEFQEALQRYFSGRAAASLMEEIASAAATPARAVEAPSQAELADASGPVARLLNSLIEEAIDRNASDLHIEPRTGRYVARLRVDGILRPMVEIPVTLEAGLISRLKVLARMDIAEHRRPQDGRMSYTHRGQDYHLRLSVIPVSENREKMTIRILKPFNAVMPFPDLGLDAEDVERLERLYRSPYGIVLVCGPTGCGKTTTLYAVLNKLNEDVRNISTVEDPIEFRIDGLNQSQINPKVDYTFASSIRSLMRQDPDVLMVGEIRDGETLNAAIQAALTGHLVFSTLHANTASAALLRLVDMGAPPHLVSASVIGVVAQRLLRMICAHCKEAYAASLDEKRIIYPYDENRQKMPLTLYRGRGCDACGHQGYAGRTGAYEIMLVERELRHLINQRRSDIEIEDAAVSAGMVTLPVSARCKVVAGVTSLDEMVRVLGMNLHC